MQNDLDDARRTWWNGEREWKSEWVKSDRRDAHIHCLLENFLVYRLVVELVHTERHNNKLPFELCDLIYDVCARRS